MKTNSITTAILLCVAFEVDEGSFEITPDMGGVSIWFETVNIKRSASSKSMLKSTYDDQYETACNNAASYNSPVEFTIVGIKTEYISNKVE